jgi:cell division transport system permease protein
MSGSYDRPTGPPPPPVAPQRPRLDSFTGPPSQPLSPAPAAGDVATHADMGYRDERDDGDAAGSAPAFQETAGHRAPQPDLDLRADERVPVARGARKGQGAPIVPPDSVTGKSLTLVVSIMCFLACLTAGAVYMVNQSANAWIRDIASEVTIQIEPREKVDTERLVKDVATFVAKQPGVRAVKPMGLDESAALIEPWLGTSEALKSLPLPRLIAIDLDRADPPDFAALRQKLAQQFKGVALDDHRHWQAQIRTVTRSLALGGLGILMLVGAATTAIIISATRSSMSANREIVEVLHFVGASDRFIAREFERHFLALGVRAGLVGAGFAMLVFFFMPMGMELLGGGSATMAEMRRLVGVGTLDPAGYIVLVVVVVIIAALCMLTSRVSVFRILNSQH